MAHFRLYDLQSQKPAQIKNYTCRENPKYLTGMMKDKMRQLVCRYSISRIEEEFDKFINGKSQKQLTPVKLEALVKKLYPNPI